MDAATIGRQQRGDEVVDGYDNRARLPCRCSPIGNPERVRPDPAEFAAYRAAYRGYQIFDEALSAAYGRVEGTYPPGPLTPSGALPSVPTREGGRGVR